MDVFLHFFKVKKQGKSFWVSFFGIVGRILLSLFQNSYKNWKGKFFRVCSAKHDPTALDGFPLYWMERPKLLRAKALEELSPADREVSKAFAGLGIVFDTLKLVASEYNAHALTTYFGKETLPFAVNTLLTGRLFPRLPPPVSHGVMLLASHASMCFVILYSCFGPNFCCLVCFDVGSVMDASKRMMLAKAMKEARAAKAGASSAPAADPIPPPTLSPPPPKPP